MRLKLLAIATSAAAMLVAPAFAYGPLSTGAGARVECTIVGTAADDALNGTTRDDVMCGKAGQDDLVAGEGNDLVRGGTGDDESLDGEDGSDTLRGQQDDDELDGADQNDKMYGGQGDDLIGAEDEGADEENQPENGDDFLKSHDGVSGNDTLRPDPGTDTCVIDAGDIIEVGATGGGCNN
jgi:Ca2+-binding RTX toxin-like protein